MAQREKPTQYGTQDVAHADTPDCRGEQSNLRLGASRPQTRKSGSNKCHWPDNGQQPCTDNKRGLDTSPVTVFARKHPSLLAELGAPRSQLGALPSSRSTGSGNDSQSPTCSSCTHTDPLQCKMLPEYLNQGVQCAKLGTSTCLQRPRNWYGTPCKWRKTNMIAEGNRHVQPCTLSSIVPWISTPWTDPARLALIHATVQPVHATTGSLRTLPLSCLLAHSAWRSCPLNARLKMVLLDLRDCIQEEPCTILFSVLTYFALGLNAALSQPVCTQLAKCPSPTGKIHPQRHGRPNQRSRYRADGTRRRTPGQIKKREPFLEGYPGEATTAGDSRGGTAPPPPKALVMIGTNEKMTGAPDSPGP